MIDKILESNFNRLDSIYNTIMEAEAPDVIKKYRDQRATPTYLYLILERFLKGSRTGSYLSPASWLKKRSLFFLDKYAKHEAMLLSKGVDKKEVEEKAVDLTEHEISTEIEAKREELRRKEPHLSDDEIGSKINRLMPLHTNVPTWTEMSVDSQRVGDQEVFLGTGELSKGSEIPIPELLAQSKTSKSLKSSYLSAMRTLVRVRDAAPTWHDPNISKMVIFGDGASIPLRLRSKLDKLKQKINDVSGEIEMLAASDNPAERTKVGYKEGELKYYRSQISSTSIGAWRPEDLNELVYGSVEPPNPAEVDAARIEDLPGLIPNLYFLIGGSDEMKTKRTEALGVQVGQEKTEPRQGPYSSHLDDLIFGVDKTRKTPEEKAAEKQRLEKMRGKWRKSNGDLRDISQDLYIIVVEYLMERIPNIKNKLEQKRVERPDQAKRIDVQLSKLIGIVPEKGEPTVIVGNQEFTKKKSGWNDGRDIKDPADKDRNLNNLSAIQDVNLLSQYNMGSVVKRVAIAQMIAEAVDQSIYQWVLNKVGDSIYKVAEPSNAGVLNIGSDPGVVNNFLCSIDHVESRYGINARMSWYLIPFVDKHRSNADNYFAEAQPITSSSEKFKDAVSVRFEDFNKWKPGVLDFETKKIIRDKSGHPIKITGEGFDYYMNLAMYFAVEEGKIDDDEQYEIGIEIDTLAKKLKDVAGLLNDSSSDIESLKGQIEAEDNEALSSKLNMELARAGVAHKELEEQHTGMIKQIADLEKHLDDSLAVVFNAAKQLQQLGPKALETIERRRKGKVNFDENVFQTWLRESGRGADLDKATKAYEEASDKESAQIELERTRRGLEKEFRQEAGAIPEEDNLPTPEAQDLIKSLSEPYADYSYERLAEIATKRINEGKPEEEHQDITPEQVELVMGGEGIGRSHENVMSFMVNTLKGIARDTAGSEDTSKISEHMNHLIKEDSAKFFISAIAEMITAMVEMSIIQSSQTNIFSGGGLKTDISYEDEFGALHMPPGWDSGEIYGQRSNPYAIIRQKQQMIERMQEELDSGDLVGEQINAKQGEIQKQEALIEEYRRKMLDNPNIAKMADRAHAIAGPSNPFLPQNKEYFDKLNNKMAAHFAGEEVEWETRIDEGTGQEISDLDMIEFLHKNTPMMQSMGINVARVAGRYLVPIRRSIDVLDVAGQPPTNNKDITDLGAMNTSNVLTGLLDMIGASKYLHALDGIFEEHGINKALENITIPTRIAPYLAMELALWSNGAKMKGGLGTDGGALTREFVRGKLFEYLSAVKVPQHKINRVSDFIVEQMIKLSVPDEKDLETNRSLYRSTMPLFSDMLRGTETLANYSDLPYNPADMKIVMDLVDGITNMRKGEKVEDMEKRVRDFVDFSNDLVIDKDSEEVFTNVLDDLGDVDRLDNLSYLVDKAQHLEAMYELADDSVKESIAEEIDVVNGEISKLASELENRSILLDTSNTTTMLNSIASYRDRAKNKLESRIERYKDVPPETISDEKIENIASKLHEFRNVINASGRYHRARSEAERAIKPEDKQKAEEERDLAYREISGSMDKLKLSTGESSGSELVHKFTTGELDEFSKEYRERQGLYDIMITTRNNILGTGTSPGEIKEQFVSICRKLMEMTKHYNKKPEDIASELLDRAAQYEKGTEFKGEKRRRAEKAFGGFEMEVLVRIPGDDTPLMAAIYPREIVAEKLEKILGGGGSLEVTLLNPMNFVKSKTNTRPEYGKSTILVDYNNISELEKQEGKTDIKSGVFKPRDETIIFPEEDFSIKDKMSIIRDQEIDFVEHEKLSDYLNTKDKMPVIISFK